MSGYTKCSECGVPLRADNEAAHMEKVHPTVAFEPKDGHASRPSRPRFYVTSGARKALFAVLTAVVMVVAGAMIYLSTQKAVPMDPNAQQVRISMAGWDPATLTTKAGVPLKVDVMALDDAHGAGHDFVLGALNINEYVGSTQKVFTLPADVPGQYTFYCSLCCGGKDSPTMVGSYTVEG